MDQRSASFRVLVVDDDVSVRELLVEYLQGRGHTVASADSGERAIELLHNGVFDVVIADLKMPGIGGLAVLRAARSLQQPPAFILISGYATLDSALSCLQEGAHDYLLKPFKLSELHDAMLRAVERAGASQNSARQGGGLDGALDVQRMAESVAGPEDWQALYERITCLTREATDADVCTILHHEEVAEEWNTLTVAAADASAMRSLARLNPDALCRRLETEGPFATSDTQALYFGDEAPAVTLAVAPVRVMRVRGTAPVAAMVVAASGRPIGFDGIAALEVYAAVLGNALTRRTLSDQLRALHAENLSGLAALIGRKDSGLRCHTERVARYAQAVARHIGLSEAGAAAVMWGARLHDIGKIGVSVELLYKKERLSDDDYDALRSHATLGEQILEKVEVEGPVRDCILFHHERWDGNGYPNGLSGPAIPLGARILAVCDAYDAITGRRAYVQNCSHAHATSELRKGAGSQFDPAVVEAFLVVIGAFLENGEPALDVEVREG